jgi:glycine cleavage system aminomethyltransferase T
MEQALAVRTRAAIFDVSHMSEIEITGRDTLTGVAWFLFPDSHFPLAFPPIWR